MRVDLKKLCLHRLSSLFSDQGAAGLLKLGDDLACGLSPGREPYNSMTIQTIEALLDQAYERGDFARWLLLEQFVFDKFNGEELRMHSLTVLLATRLMKDLCIRSLPVAELIVSSTHAFVVELLAKVSGLGDATR